MNDSTPRGASRQSAPVPIVEQHELLQQVLRRNLVSRRSMLRGSVGVAGAAFLLGGGAAGTAFAETLTSTGTIADGFVVNGRHLAFGPNPEKEMWVAGQLFNLTKFNAVPSGIKVHVQYGRDASYGHAAAAEIRELVTHVPVWNGNPKGPITASTTDLLHADQFYVHALLDGLAPGETYHYRFVYTKGGKSGSTPDATFTTAPTGRSLEPFTFSALGDQGITGAKGTGNTIDNAVSLQPESSTHITDDYYNPMDPDYYDPASKKAPTNVSPVNAIVSQIAKLRNPDNHTPSRFNLMMGDICYANPSGDAEPIINQDGKGGTQPAGYPKNSGGWDDFDPYVWTSYLSTLDLASSRAPWMFTTGNHDVELFSAKLDADSTTIHNYGAIGYGGHAKRLDLPKNGPSKCPSVYSFRYGNVGVVSVDANDLSFEIQGLLGYSHGTQRTWLEKTLAEFRADSTIDFVVAFYHHCAFSTCESHSSDGGVRKVLAPLFAKYHVDAAFQGHNHLYERTNPIKYSAASNEGTSTVNAASASAKDAAVVFPEKDGTTYFTVGSGGRPRYDWSSPTEVDRNYFTGVGSKVVGHGTEIHPDAKKGVGPYTSQPDFTDKYESINWSQSRYQDYAFVAIDVVPAKPDGTTTMTVRAINEQGVEFDRVIFSRKAGA